MKEKIEKHVEIKNRQARFEYEILETYSAGMVLVGTEIKSIRQSRVSLQEAHCVFKGKELFILNMNINAYENASFANHAPRRERKLLLKKRELEKLKEKVEEKGLTLIPLRLFIDEKGRAKIEIALARGKKLFDKREDLKEKAVKRELDRQFKS